MARWALQTEFKEKETPMYYILATTETKVRWYYCKLNKDGEPTGFHLMGRLDLKRVSVFGDKKSAKHAALELGLKTWRYVKF